MQFDFGQNWADYSSNAITPERITQAIKEFELLLSYADLNINEKTFLDIGFGQGFCLLQATALGALTVGCDINPKCAEVIERNRIHFPETAGKKIPVTIGSILDPKIVEKLKDISPEEKGYDIVHSWGVLHHTGNMKLAIENAAKLVKPSGYLVIAIYNRHWSSAAWRAIKWLYCKSPSFVQRLFIIGLYPVIYTAKWWVTRSDPQRQLRGMDFFYNVIDWVGGYPYEYASSAEVIKYIESMGFRVCRFVPAQVPTGCNEFIFRQKP